MISDLKIPTIHWNGTGKETLEREYEHAYHAVCEAKQKLQAVTVHGRDYYVQSDPEAGPAALKQAWWRIEQLEKVQAELETILIGIQNQEKRG